MARGWFSGRTLERTKEQLEAAPEAFGSADYCAELVRHCDDLLAAMVAEHDAGVASVSGDSSESSGDERPTDTSSDSACSSAETP